MIELIPAIDLINGQCVRLKQGNYEDQTVYDPDPVRVSRNLESLGVRRLHLVDLDGAKAGHVVNIEVLRGITQATDLLVDFGGGLQSADDIASVFGAGASMITLGSLAVKDPEQFLGYLEEYGSARIILGADVRNGQVSIHGWQQDTEQDLFSLVSYFRERGVDKLICTDISRDGMLVGPAIDLYRELKAAFPGMEIIASGGVKGIEDIQELDELGISGVIFGKAFYEGKISASAIVEFLQQD